MIPGDTFAVAGSSATWLAWEIKGIKHIGNKERVDEHGAVYMQSIYWGN